MSLPYWNDKAVRKLESRLPARDGWLDHVWKKVLPPPLAREFVSVDAHIREGRFQRSLSLMAGASSVLAGLEVSYEHYQRQLSDRRSCGRPWCSAAR